MAMILKLALHLIEGLNLTHLIIIIVSIYSTGQTDRE